MPPFASRRATLPPTTPVAPVTAMTGLIHVSCRSRFVRYTAEVSHCSGAPGRRALVARGEAPTIGSWSPCTDSPNDRPRDRQRTATGDGRRCRGRDHHPARQHHQSRQQRDELLQLLHHSVEHHRRRRGDDGRAGRCDRPAQRVAQPVTRCGDAVHGDHRDDLQPAAQRGRRADPDPVGELRAALHLPAVHRHRLAGRPVGPAAVLPAGTDLSGLSGRLRRLQPDPRPDRRLVPVPVPGPADCTGTRSSQ